VINAMMCIDNPGSLNRISLEDSPTQGCVLHSFHCNVSPVQFLPPYIGVGFVHDRRLSETPLLHGLLQYVQELQSVSPPSTKIN
jgi:hypothetical protein